ncbi:MAG: hypothetical protein DWG76_06270 [Chloroflexi bacterium]|nr:hypothetical protein [Chloroflexota bacterium]
MSIPPGDERGYRLAQLDDYAGRHRRTFPWRPPLTLKVRARASASASPGTWGFGIWNDPFGMALGFGGQQRLPALPQAAWFFFAAPENHLALRDDLPAQGSLAATFRATPFAYALAPLAIPAIPFFFLRPTSRALRRAASAFIPQDAVALDLDPAGWHNYTLEWLPHQVHFSIDGQRIHSSAISPRPPLGLVIWIDNQYAGWHPSGQLGFGTLASDAEQWIEIKDFQLN